MADADEIRRAAARIAPCRGHVAALTGAGISVESGVPDFRSAGGIWDRYNPMEYATIDAFVANPKKVWPFLLELGSLLAGARPNAAHRALADLEAAGVLAGVATQNIDGLHQAAGSRRVFELHGTAERLRCASCGRPGAARAGDPEAFEARLRAAPADPPRCGTCGGLLKPDVILFGEPLPQDVYAAAEALVRDCAALLVIGTSATVWPVAGLPGLARRHGAVVVELNLAPTDLTGGTAELSVFGPAGEVLPLLARALLERS